jgi:CO dehydrogenase nickel-insertion accessory protein CooC1
MKIQILAKPGEGKSTMAAAVANFLRGQGFGNVSLVDADVPDGSFSEEEVSQRLKALTPGAVVEISTEQMPRR